MADVTTIILALLGSAVISAFVSHRGELARAREELVGAISWPPGAW
jgi:hypothetical protein